MAELQNEAVEEIIPEDTMRGKFLVFSLNGQEFAIAIEYVIDIINVQPITRVPNCPDYVQGITNLRGKVIPIIDMRLRFGKEQQPYNDRTCIIVVEVQEMQVGLIIDNVSEVIHLEDENIAPPPAVGNSAESRYILGIGKAEQSVILLLDCEVVLQDDRMTAPVARRDEE